MDRRAVLVGAAATVVGAAGPTDPVADLERRYGGRLGVYALDLATGRVIAHRANEIFKLESSFKGVLTALVLWRVASGHEKLDALVHYDRSDLVAASPVTTAKVEAGVMTVGELCAATMATSDNTAANLLMRREGGPEAVTAFLRSIGDWTTRIDNYENPRDGAHALPEADTTTPKVITATLRKLLLEPILPDRERELWKSWLKSNRNGLKRLRAAFPSVWESGDRTGTADGICDDYAFACRPGRAPLLVSAYYAAPGLTLAAQEAVLRQVGRIVVTWQS